MDCPICGVDVGESTYPNRVCDDCDERAVSADAADQSGPDGAGTSGDDDPWHGFPPGEEPDTDDGTIHLAPDRGENPVFIDGEKCWRRYRFGGWVTMKDDHDCDSIEEFYEEHGSG